MQILEVRESRRFIAYEYVGSVAGVRDVVIRKVELERRYARQSPCWCADLAGKSGSVERSLPNVAVSAVKRSPVNCMPSPLSPANRMITWSS